VRSIATIALWFALVLPGSALAQSSTCQAYNPQLCGTGAGTQGASARTAGGSGSLPFTGLDLLLLAAGGGVLITSGLVVRRLAGRHVVKPEPPL
jgi:hypothetical protein